MTRIDTSGYRALFANRPFVFFWGGFTLSTVGDAMTRVALTWYVYEVTGSATALGWLAFFYTAPVVVGGLAAGWVLDRFDRRLVMAVDSLLKAALVSLVPLLHVIGSLALWHVYAVAAVFGLLMMVPLAGTPALLPSLVKPRQLTTANALETLGYTVSGVVGPPVAGVLIAWIAAPNVLLLDAATFLFFALALMSSRRRRPDAEPVPRQPADRGLRPAVRLLLTNRVLLSTTAMFMMANLGLGALLVWLPIFADRVLGGGPELYGSLLGLIAFGEIVSAVAAGAVGFPLTLGCLICLAQASAGVSLVLLLASPRLAVAGLALVLFGLCHAPLTIWAQTLRMAIIPEAQRGRCFGLLRMLMQSTNPLGGLVAGFAIPLVGLTGIIAFSALVTGLPGLLGLRIAALREAGRPMAPVSPDPATALRPPDSAPSDAP